MTNPLLSHVIVGERPAHHCLVLHGILGSKSNWRSHARRWAEALPSWGFVLADLRNHGDAQSFASPHTLDAVAADLGLLCASLDRPVTALVGHSFGGKSALCLAARPEGHSVQKILLLDANPGVRPIEPGSEETLTVLDSLEAVGEQFSQRQDFIAAMRARGHSQALSTWLAMNLVHCDQGLHFRLKTKAIREMLEDYFTRDLWPFIEAPGGPEVHVLAGGRSSVFTASDVDRMRAIAQRQPERRSVTVLPSAGHWLHADAPEEVNDWVINKLG